MTIELTGWQKLWDVTKDPWRELLPPARLKVVRVTQLATGRGDRTPYSLILSTDDGTRLELEVVDGQELVAITQQ